MVYQVWLETSVTGLGGYFAETEHVDILLMGLGNQMIVLHTNNRQLKVSTEAYLI
jgi:hypothetical protein